LAKALQGLGHEVAIIAASHGLPMSQLDLPIARTVSREVFDEVPFVWLPTPPYAGNSFGRLWNMRSYAARLQRLETESVGFSPDVIIGSSPHLMAADAAARRAKRLGVPFVAEIRDIWPQSLVDLGVSSRHPFVIYQAALEKRVYRCARGLITLLPGSVDYFTSRGVSKDKIVVIPNGIDLSLVPSPQPEPEGFTGIYTGAHGPANNLDVILDAAKLVDIPGFRVLLVGSGPEKTRLQERALAEGIPAVSFLDPVPKEDVFALLASANVCLHTLSDAKVFAHGVSPNKMFDYMSVGRPVIVSASVKDSPVELAGCGRVIRAGDSVALAAALGELASLTSLERAALGQRGREYVQLHHDLTSLAATLANFLEGIKSS
jgi:glycosyltransferase involved in cell wall biosynthesis